MPMTVDDLLVLLAPLTPAVLPIMAFIWYRTRQELQAIKGEVAALRQVLTANPGFDRLAASVELMRVDIARAEARPLIASGGYTVAERTTRPREEMEMTAAEDGIVPTVSK
jgi:hypothetical protein